MNTEKRTMLTVVTESVIENALLADLERLGARGYTITDARGRGTRGVRDANWGAAANIRIEIICARPLANTLLTYLQQRYYDNYAMVACLHEIEVLRPEKF